MESKFMDNKKTDLYYARKIIADLTFVIAHTKGLTLPALLQDINKILQ